MSAPAPVILIVDDSPTIQRTLAFSLEREGYEVVVAHDGEEGLTRLKERLPAVAFVDAVMPGIDGYELCQRVRADPAIHPQPFLIMLTGEGQDTDRDRAMNAGVDEFMTKPFRPSALAAHLREILEGG